MNFNQGYTDYPHVQCDRCVNKDICKYTEKYKSICEEVANITTLLDTDIPISITVDCKKFNKDTVTWGVI